MLLHELPRRPLTKDGETRAVSFHTQPAVPQRSRMHDQAFNPKEYGEVAQVFKRAKVRAEEERQNRVGDASPQQSLDTSTNQTNNSKALSAITEKADAVSSLSSHKLIASHDDTAAIAVESMILDLPGKTDYTAFERFLASNPDLKKKMKEDKINDTELAKIMSQARNHHLADEFFINGTDLAYADDILGFLEPNVASKLSRPTTRPGKQQYKWVSGSQVKADWEAKHKADGYLVVAPDREHNLGKVVTLCYMTLAFPKDMEFDEHLTLYPEFSAPGERNPDLYATQALNSDPAMRLAIRAQGILKNKEEFDMYLQRDTLAAVEAANSFADRVLEGIDTVDLDRRPRRHVPRYRDRH